MPVRKHESIAPSSPEFILGVPAYNEAETILRVLHDLKRSVAGLEESIKIVVFDDNSEDDTVAVVLGTFDVEVRRAEYNLGYERNVLRAIRYAQLRSCGLILFDGDGQHSPLNLGPLVKAVGSGNDVVVASGCLAESKRHVQRAKIVVSKLYCLLIKLLASEEISDPTSGNIALSFSAINYWASQPDLTFFMEACFLVSSKLAGLTITEVPGPFLPASRKSRIHNCSKASAIRVVRCVALCLRGKLMNRKKFC
jgi:glycosyltransferase involved in cell wall biosynthesis